MGIFNKLDKMQEENFKQICEVNHIDSSLFDDEDMEMINYIAGRYMGDKFNNVGNLLGKADLQTIYNYIYPRIDTIIIQNFMIIKELKKLNKK